MTTAIDGTQNTGLLVQAFRYWFLATPMGSLGLTTLTDALNYYDQYPAFKQQFNTVLSSVPLPQIQTAMVNLANDFGTAYPPPDQFFSHVAAVTGSVSSVFSNLLHSAENATEKASNVIGSTVASVPSLLKGSLLLYVAIAAGGLFLLPALLKAKRA